MVLGSVEKKFSLLALISLAILAASSSAFAMDLVGRWQFRNIDEVGLSGDLGIVTINQDENEIIGKWDELTDSMSRDYGFKRGDVVIEATVDANRLIGRIRLHHRVKYRSKCPGKWEIWEKLGDATMDGPNRIRGRRRNFGLSDQCKREDQGWVRFEMVRIAPKPPVTVSTPPIVPPRVDRPAYIIADSGFGESAEGWETTTEAERPRLTPRHVGSGGHPGGFISLENLEDGTTWYWKAPAKFLGYALASYGQNLLFDLMEAGTGEVTQGDDLRLSGDGVVLSLGLPSPPAPRWKTYAVRLDESQDWHNKATGQAATASDIETVLRSLESVTIRANHRVSSSQIGLDNVVLGGSLRRPSKAKPVEKPPRPVRLDLVLETASALVGRAISLYVYLVDEEGEPVSADREYDIRFRAENGDVRPAQIFMSKGDRHAMARVYGTQAGEVPIRASTDSLARESETTASYCEEGEVATLAFSVHKQESEIRIPIEARFQLVDASGTLVTDGKTKLVELSYVGVGAMGPINAGAITAGECATKVNIIADKPGKATLRAALGTSQPKERLFLFYLPTARILVLVLVSSIGGIAGALVRAATIWSASKAWSVTSWLIHVAIGAVAGGCLFLVYHYGLLEIAGEVRSDIIVVGLLGLIGGYLGQLAMDRIANIILPPTSNAS